LIMVVVVLCGCPILHVDPAGRTPLRIVPRFGCATGCGPDLDIDAISILMCGTCR
jgi:hypothetical protein